jgi:hypothetical protein
MKLPPASARSESLHPTLEAFFGELDRSGAAWCLLRGEDDLARPSGDVDLLVARDDLPRVRGVLERLGFVPLPAWGYAPHAFFLAYEPFDDDWIKLDLVTALAFGPYFALESGAAAESLIRRVRVDGVNTLAPVDAFWALFLHCLLDEGTFPPGHRERLQKLASAARGGGPLERAFAAACPPGWSSARAVESVERGDWGALVGIRAATFAAWRRRQPFAAWRKTVTNAGQRRLGRLLRALRRRGLGVALVAPDGAGKSTLAAGLGESFYFPVRSIYMGLYQRGGKRGHGRWVPGLGLTGRLVTQWSRWLGARYHQARGRLVVFDRYAYDALLPPRRPTSRRGRVRRWLLGHACPRPDLVVMLDAPGQVLYERKGELSPAVLEAERMRYLELRRLLPEIVVIDATQEPNQVRRELVSLIWQSYQRRWGRAQGAS